ncbi:MAG: glutaredoxin domain-containing protein [Armatimonadota bacterium]
MSESKVTIYSTPTCPHCKHAKEYLKEKGIEFTDYNVATDLEARKAMMDKSGQMGVPVIMVDDEIVVGFNRARLDQLLG